MSADTDAQGNARPGDTPSPGRKIGTGLLTPNDQFPGTYDGEVKWFGFPVHVRIAREAGGVRCDFFQLPQPDWAVIPFIDGYDPDKPETTLPPTPEELAAGKRLRGRK